MVRTSEKSRRMSAEDGVRNYKRLTQVERAFRSWKGLDLMVRPIFHRMVPRVKAHIFLCLLAYYVEWEMRRAWAPLLFADEEVEADREERDPVARAEPSARLRAHARSRRGRRLRRDLLRHQLPVRRSQDRAVADRRRLPRRPVPHLRTRARAVALIPRHRGRAPRPLHAPSITSTAAPRMASRSSSSSAWSAAVNGNVLVRVARPVRAASARKPWPSARVLFATLWSIRSP